METPRFLRLSSAYTTTGSDLKIARYELRPARVEDPDFVPGDLLARIWSVFGPPHEGKPDEQFDYTFLDTKTRVVFAASSSEAREPEYELLGIYDGALPPPPEPDAHFRRHEVRDDPPQILDPRVIEEALRAMDKGAAADPRALDALRAMKKGAAKSAPAKKGLRDSALAFEELLARAKLADCALLVKTDYGLYRIGAAQGRVLNEHVSFADAVDFYVDLVKQYGPKRDVAVYYLAEPQAQIRWLWSEASDADRKLRPDAVEYARRAWQDQFENLAKKIVLEESDQRAWSLAWSALDEDCALVGMNTPDIRKELDRLREPPPVPKLTERERNVLQSAMWFKQASPHWSEAERQERTESDRKRTLEHPELTPARIVERLAASRSAEERHLAELLRDALRP
jgi:hypothetical protein